LTDPEPEPTSEPAPRTNRWALAGLFVLGALSASLVVVPRRFPVETYAAWCQLRYGGLPSGRGLLLTLRPCPPDLRGKASGPEPSAWVLLEFRNLAPGPSMFVLPEQTGEELSVVVRADGRELPRRSDPARESQAQALRAQVLGPRDRLAFPLDLARYVELPEIWSSLEVEVTRAQLGGDGHTCYARAVIP
jgi:hypothetical protein